MGLIDVGDQLPSVREVVTATAVNLNTVLKAYRDLEREGLVAAAAAAAAACTPSKRPIGRPGITAAFLLGRSLARWVREAHAAGLDDESIESLLRVTLRAATEEETA